MEEKLIRLIKEFVGQFGKHLSEESVDKILIVRRDTHRNSKKVKNKTK